ncbi:hypothetical protein KR76_04280 [Pimelobacter simplex]|uniref:Uncharacterized protein n=3 Tax=Nocardioides simplex TaxID=2045 RepID=A0A0A1DHR4_NOCSI|nr:hypothetical protein KR76_04280 [Pimelobacter simplex]GEB12206.1 hypothetical protein NSI01_05210 [Pimelobacter simplex]SFN16702.1 hypothetical protein SAMN05421671_5493 [Pimelobacter simplex]
MVRAMRPTLVTSALSAVLLSLLLSACGDGTAGDDEKNFDSARDAADALEGAISEITKTVTITEDNDPNDDMLGRPNGYEAGVVLFDQRAGDEFTTCTEEQIGADCGATIEQWPDAESATARMDYIQGLLKDAPILGREYNYVQGKLLLRVSGTLKPSEADEYEAAFTGTTPKGKADDDKSSDTDYDAATATAGEKWAEYTRLATEAGIAEEHWASTETDAADTAEAACGRTQEQMNGSVDLFRDIYTEDEFEAERLFYVAYCPEQVEAFDTALDYGAGASDGLSSGNDVPTVSLSTACAMLIPDSGDGELNAIAEFLSGTTKATPDTFRDFKASVAEVNEIAGLSPEPLATYLTGMVDSLQAYVDDLTENGAGDLDTTVYKALGLEVVNLCTGG